MEQEKLLSQTNEYFNYIIQHQLNVRKAWNDMKPLISGIGFLSDWNVVDEMDWRISRHDESKFREEEFIPYRRHFYPVEGEEPDDVSFQKAWELHIRNNPHHWQYWVAQDGAFIKAYNVHEKIFSYLEMICDWQAMGYVKGDNALLYYNAHKDEIKIDPDWVNFVEEVLQLVCGDGGSTE